MRILFFLIFLIGATAGIGAPFIAERLGGTGPDRSFGAFQPASGFRAVEVPLTAADAPLDVLVELTAPGPFVPDATLSSAALTVALNGRTVLATPVTFRDPVLRDDNPQTPERRFRQKVGTIPTLEDGTYTVTVSRGEIDIPQATAIDVVLRHDAPALDRRIQPVGFAAMAVGFIGFMLAAFRRKQPASGGTSAPAEAVPKEEKPRWGRDAG